MISLDEARATLARAVSPLPAVEVDLAAALGCRVAVPPRSDVDLPPADVSAMDGYAVRHADLAPGGPLPVAFEVTAGTVADPLPAGEAARIFTGAILPAGADTVVPQEQARSRADGRVELEVLPFGSYVRRQGEVLAADEPLAAEGQLITAQRLGLLAAAAPRPIVVPRPRLAVVVTGSEIVPPGTRPRPGQIRNANGPLLDALARSAGLAPPLQLAAPDELGPLREALREAVDGADLVLTSGGVSVGDYDLVPEAVRALGGEVLFHRVAVKPGKPVLAARLGSNWLIGLPGNPVSVMVSWRMFGRPLAAALAGERETFAEEPVLADLREPVANRGDRTELRPAVLQRGDTPRVQVLGWRGSHDLMSAAAADALARIEVGATLAAGEVVPCYPLDPCRV